MPARGGRLDTVTLKDLYAAFADFSHEQHMDPDAFTACLSRMGIGVPFLSQRLFKAFDKHRKDRLEFRDFAEGMSLVCNSATAAARLELSFAVLDVHDVATISRVEIQSMVDLDARDQRARQRVQLTRLARREP